MKFDLDLLIGLILIDISTLIYYEYNPESFKGFGLVIKSIFIPIPTKNMLPYRQGGGFPG